MNINEGENNVNSQPFDWWLGIAVKSRDWQRWIISVFLSDGKVQQVRKLPNFHPKIVKFAKNKFDKHGV